MKQIQIFECVCKYWSLDSSTLTAWWWWWGGGDFYIWSTLNFMYVVLWNTEDCELMILLCENNLNQTFFHANISSISPLSYPCSIYFEEDNTMLSAVTKPFQQFIAFSIACVFAVEVWNWSLHPLLDCRLTRHPGHAASDCIDKTPLL